jgi:hypothetical protein
MKDAEPADLELMLNQFRRLYGELLRGTMSRHTFLPWEVGVILDFQETKLPGKRRMEILRQWERAVVRQMQIGPGPPMKLSEFVKARDERRATLKPAEPAGPQFGICRPPLPI